MLASATIRVISAIRAISAIATFALITFSSRPAAAHDLGVSQSDLVVEGERVRAHLVFARGEASTLVRGGTDADVKDLLASGVAVTADGANCPPTLDGARVIEADGFAIDATFTCPHPPHEVVVTLYLLGELPRGHRHLARLEAGAFTTQALLDEQHRSLSLVLESDEAPAAPLASGFASTVMLGIRHILLGWDHLLFLFVLLLGATAAGARLRALVAIVTAFTLAHSITLALAALGVVTLPAALVEPAIALSIALAAFDNAARRHLPRALIAFAFGLVHGFGFASALRDLDLSRDRLLPALLGFNLGVELGQLAVVLSVVPILRLLRRRGALEDRRTRVSSIAIGVLALALCLERIIIGP